jgi:hypothetical protein
MHLPPNPMSPSVLVLSTPFSNNFNILPFGHPMTQAVSFRLPSTKTGLGQSVRDFCLTKWQ